VTLINIDEGSALASIEIVAESDIDIDDIDNGTDTALAGGSEDAEQGESSPAADGEEAAEE
jgi:hypothetical protein